MITSTLVWLKNIKWLKSLGWLKKIDWLKGFKWVKGLFSKGSNDSTVEVTAANGQAVKSTHAGSSMKKKYFSGKTYTHSQGFSCAFRQWRATHSHCQYLHGYALQVEFEFSATHLDDKNWAVDFGGLDELKDWLKTTFDHTTCIARDDPHLSDFRQLHEKGIIDLIVFDDGVGCEKFAEYAFNEAAHIIGKAYGDRCQVVSCTVREHDGNSATVKLA